MKKLLLLLVCVSYNSFSQPRIPYIIGGQNANQGQFPWLGDIHFNSQHGCGCTLISPEWVVTAAHCVEDYMPISSIRFNTVSTTGAVNPSGGEQRTVIQSHKHPTWSTQDNNSVDIALLKLSSPITTITPSILPIAPTNENLYTIENNILVTGWGITQVGGSSSANILQWATSKIKTCTGNSAGQPTNTNIYFCIGYSNGENPTGSAAGDSGGPAFTYNSENKPILLGVVSHGEGQTQTTNVNKPGRFTKVINYVEWILSITGPLNTNKFETSDVNISVNDGILSILGSTQKAEISIYNSLGKKITEIPSQSYNDNSQIDISNFSNGVYILKMKNDNGEVLSKKFIK